MMIISKKQFKNQEGVVLVMSLMILLVMMLSVITLTQVIFGEIKMTRNADSSIVAFYTAESGVERGLYYLKFAKEQGDFSYFERLIDPDPYSVSPDEYYSLYDLGEEGVVQFVEATTTASYYEVYDFGTSTPAKIDIVRPGENIPTAATDLPESFKVEWSINDCQDDGHASDQMEISYTSLKKTGGILDSDVQQTVVTCGCTAGSNDSCDDVLRNNIDNDKFYYFTFRPLDDDVHYLKFTPYMGNDQTGLAFLPSEVFLQVYGSYRQAMHSISVKIPVFTPSSNIFNYVVFSEQDLEKGF